MENIQIITVGEKRELAESPDFAALLAKLHIKSFSKFFLIFLGEKFLTLMYSSYMHDASSDIEVALDGERVLGFVAYSFDTTQLYKSIIKSHFFCLVWICIKAFFRKPKYLLKIIRTFLKANKQSEESDFIEITSVCVDKDTESKGIGSKLLQSVIKKNSNKAEFFLLNTDAVNNDRVNAFYLKNGFMLSKTYTTADKRKMNEYRFYPQKDTLN